jgi:hypothetical protein
LNVTAGCVAVQPRAAATVETGAALVIERNFLILTRNSSARRYSQLNASGNGLRIVVKRHRIIVVDQHEVLPDRRSISVGKSAHVSRGGISRIEVVVDGFRGLVHKTVASATGKAQRAPSSPAETRSHHAGCRDVRIVNLGTRKVLYLPI